MKIGFTGAAGTGKTSLMNRLGTLSEFRDFELVGSSARRVKAMGLPINQDATPLSQTLIMETRMAMEILAGDDYITDRTPLDSLAYTSLQLGTWKSEPHIDQLYVNHMTIVRDWMKRYDHVFYFPPFDFIVDDGTRPTDTKYQKAHDAEIQRLLNLFKVEYTMITAGSIHDRVVHVLDVIQ